FRSVNFRQPRQPQAAAEGPLAGQTVVVTGKMSGPLENMGRSEMNALVEKAGGRAGSSVNSKTTYLVCAPSANGKPSSKAVKAAELGVTVLTPEAFAELVADCLG
ncbi:BRCT domain-containing protein, partial [Streptomyces sp. NPDC001586]|uniref:BRCT domain-containing protein n=1 Tax=Streptomyces sp. NPDC001586 TaxID=3154387 RepID=UPI003331ED01